MQPRFTFVRSFSIAVGTAIICALSLAVPATALTTAPHAPMTAAAHASEDAVVHSPAMAQRLNAHTIAMSAAPSAAAAATVSSDPGQSGQWGSLMNWPVVAINAAVLPNGQLMVHDDVGDSTGSGNMSYTDYTDHTYTRVFVWNRARNTFSPDWVDGFDIFCSGLAHLPSGAIFTAGGNADDVGADPIYATFTFNNLTSAWTRGPDMTYPRWYPTVTALTDGEMLISGGGPWIPEVRGTDGSVYSLNSQTATQSLPLYPWMNVAPDGRVFFSGPDDMLLALDPTNGGSWTNFGARGDGINRDYGSHVMYDVGKILVAGGGPSTNTAETIDINGSTPVVQPTSPMNFGRRQFNLTALADGTVLATGGNSTGAQFVDMNGGVYNAERWDPATGTWTTLAAESVTRQYHSTAILLPDGRVLSAGGGVCGDCDTAGYLGKNAQIFSPPYLFKHDGSGQLAPRPGITGITPSADLSWGSTFQIATKSAANIRKVGLVKLGAVTHANNMDQRYVPLSFTIGTGQLTATVPQNPNLTPPGYYMLFIVNSTGVPSVAKIVWIGTPPGFQTTFAPDKPPTVSITTPANGTSYTAPGSVSISANASDPDGSVTQVEFFMTQVGVIGSTIKLGAVPGPAGTYNLTTTGVPAGTYALTARVTDNAGVTATTWGRVIITVS